MREKLSQIINEIDENQYALLKKSIEKLETHYNVSINIHNICAFSIKSLQAAGIYSFHDNCFCNYIKQEEKCFIECIKNKSRLIEKCKTTYKPFLGECYMGLREFIFPVFNQEKLIAIVCVGTFYQDFNKDLKSILHKAKEMKLNTERLKECYYKIARGNEINLSDMVNDILLIVNLIKSIYESYGEIYENLKNDEILLSSIEFINNNYMHKLTLELIADYCHCNASYLSRLFKSKCGVNIIDYVNMQRIKKAKELLRISRLSIMQIALECGFNTPDYFSQIFKKHANISPTKYRNLREK